MNRPAPYLLAVPDCVSSPRTVPAFVLLFLLLPLSPAISQRPAWTTSRVKGTPAAPLPFSTERVFVNQRFHHPVTLTSAPGTDSMFLLEQHGKIFELTSENAAKPRLIGDLSTVVKEFNAAYGLEFHPRFEQNREIFVCYIRNGAEDTGTALSRFRLTNSTPMQIDPDSEQILYTWTRGGHNGGCVKFGPDGYLYVSAGDAAAPFPPDPIKAGQDLSNLLSTIVRIDVDHPSAGLPYSIPEDNPFANLAGARPEIYAYGFRNPWRMAFDRKTGDLWVGDVGWELWEMVYNVTSGGNYGWSIVEGPKSLHPHAARGPTPILKPAASHSHAEARSITGGQVYYGDRLPELQGAYIYGDHVTGRIWTLRKQGTEIQGPTEIARAPLQIICFGLHHNGEVYIVDYLGEIHRLVRRQLDESNQAFPRLLSESGLFANTPHQEFAPGVLPYFINAEPWMDGGTAQRFVAIPGQEQIGVYTVGSGHASWDGKHRGSWKFPKDSVLGKTISLGSRRVETQLLHFDGQAWQAYSYIWNDDQTDARLAEDQTQTIEVDLGDRRQVWLVSNRADCMICHSNANDMVLGFKPAQLRRSVASHDDQLAHFEELGLFAEKAPQRPVICDPLDETNDLESRARAYLHLNCAHCHRRDGGGAVAMNVVYQQALDKAGIIDEIPTQGTFGIENARVVAPGDPYRSVLLYRFCKHGPGHMPKLGGLEVDHFGAKLLHDWIQSLGNESRLELDSELNATVIRLEELKNNEPALVGRLSNIRQSMLAAHALRTDRCEHTLRDAILAASTKLPPTSKDLFESFIPFNARTTRLGPNIDVQEILSTQGDAYRGRELFLSQNLSCKSCHTVQPGEEGVGPNLSGLQPDRYRRAALMESMLHPSKEIAESYRTQVVQTMDGKILTGVAKDVEDNLVLRDAQNKVHTIPVAEIEFRKVAEVSLMPEKLLEELTLQEARDLLEFLHNLGKKQ